MDLRVITVVAAVCWLGGASARELCLRGDFLQQFQHIMENEMLLDGEIANMARVFDDMAELLGKRWPGTVVTPFGSLVSGLGLKASDTDCLAAVPGYDETHEDYYIMETVKLMLQRPDKYDELTPSYGRVPLLTFFYKPTQKYCDLSFQSPTGLVNSRLVNYFMFLDRRIREVTLFLKYWCKLHGIVGSGMLPSYAISLMSIFFFQQKQMLPTIIQLQNNAEPVFVDGWNHGFERIPFRSPNNETVYQLLGDFFRYYSKFDFDNYMISAYSGRPALKRDFVDVETIPDEFSAYKYRLREGSIEPIPFRIPLVVQDAFEHSDNIAERKDRTVSARLIAHIKHAARMFDVLPGDMVLRTILNRERDRDLLEEKKWLVIDKVSDLKDCVS